MAISAAYHGVVLEGTERLKLKESDRSAAMVEELKKFNIQALTDGGRIWVENRIVRTPTKVLDSHNDHRIAMALTVLCTLCGGRLRNAETVNKSWPGFYKVIQNLGILITPQEETESEKQDEIIF